MNIYRKVLGITIFIVAIICIAIFIYLVLESPLRNDLTLLAVQVIGAIGLYAFIQYMVMTKLGFYPDDHLRVKSPMKFIPLALLLIMLSSVAFVFIRGYKKQKKSNITTQTKGRELLPIVEYETRQEIMSDPDMSLSDKLQKLNLGVKPHDGWIGLRFTVASDTSVNSSSADRENKLLDYYDKFSFRASRKFAESFEASNYRVSNDTVYLQLFNGRKISEQLHKGSTFLGFLKGQNLFVFEKEIQPGEYEYLSINAVNGTKLEGIPLFANLNVEHYTDIAFTRRNKEIGLDIRFWHHDVDNSYNPVTLERIPMDFYFQSSKNMSCEVDNITWPGPRQFSFKIHSLNNNRRESALVTVDVTEYF